ncbi:MAG: hypothetical protein FWB72_05910 [Firmicutes bacterium]|nr:hypothetical protein [Bacillota bacterium]
MKAIIVGSFNPIQRGHLDIIKRAALVFKDVDVYILENAAKTNVGGKTNIDASVRVGLVEKCLKFNGLSKIKVKSSVEALVDIHARNAPCVVVKGLRNTIDLEHEKSQFVVNFGLTQSEKKQDKTDRFETVFFIAKPDYAHISSSAVRVLVGLDKCIKNFVCESIVGEVKALYKK